MHYQVSKLKLLSTAYNGIMLASFNGASLSESEPQNGHETAQPHAGEYYVYHSPCFLYPGSQDPSMPQSTLCN